MSGAKIVREVKNHEDREGGRGGPSETHMGLLIGTYQR